MRAPTRPNQTHLAIAATCFSRRSVRPYIGDGAILERFPAYFLVAESDGQLVGYIHGSVQRNMPVGVIPAQEPYVESEDIYVQPDFRNSDIGGKLIERLFEAGAEVEVVLMPEGPQSDTLAADVVAALQSEPEARTFFDRSRPFTAIGYVRWIESAKRPETRSARSAEMPSLLKAGKKQR